MAGWGNLEDLLKEELRQRREEGCDIDGFPEMVARAKEHKEQEKIYRKLMRLKVMKDFPYEEPSDLKGILKKRPSIRKDLLPIKLEGEELYDRVYGAWLGRCAGCALGKPVEGWTEERIKIYLKNAGAYPLDYYFPQKSVDEQEREVRCGSPASTREHIQYMEVDDDINYTVAGLLIAESKGLNFTTQDIGDFWLSSIPFYHVCTAERQAYLNLANGMPVEEVPIFHNPYREWIGAQIRADFWGYVSPGNPAQAAELAFRDAALSHVKNGIYGEMFVAAMLSAAFSSSDMEEIVKIGAGQIPETSRLFEAVEDMLKWSKQYPEWEDAFKKMMEKYGHYHPVHTINNACIVLMGLLYGKGDFEKTITIAVMCGLDTDCNGATAGSIAGAMLGAKRIPQKWILPLNDTLSSTVVSMNESFFRTKISELARRTTSLIARGTSD